MPNFPSMLAVDEQGNIARDSVGRLYDVSDTTRARPLAVTDLNGVPFPDNAVPTSAIGVIAPFRVDGHSVVSWVSGQYRMDIPAIDAVPRGGSYGQVLGKASSEDFDFSWMSPSEAGGGSSGGGTMIPAYEANGKYTRPTTDPKICVIFTGSSDPGSVALENDRWERLS